MTKVTLYLEPAVALFYSRVADWAGLPLEQVLCDSLYKLAGELSLHALHDAKFPRRGRCGHRPLQPWPPLRGGCRAQARLGERI